MKILLAMDGSEYSIRAARYFLRHRELFDRRAVLTLLYVDHRFAERAQTVFGRKGIERMHLENARAVMEEAGRELERAGFAVDYDMLVGEPGPLIARYAKKGHFDLVAMGSHGHGALSSLVLGSVVTKVLALCSVPVLVVR